MPELILDRGGLAAVPITPPRLPVRHQRSRKRGARTPDGVVYVGRPTIFGNPFDHRRFGHARSVRLFGQWLDRRLGDLSLERLGFCPVEIEALGRKRERLIARLPSLTGRDLQCWCPLNSRWCHADALIARARHLVPAEDIPF